jgi:hypothetical protein
MGATTMTDAEYLTAYAQIMAERRAAERARDAAERDAYEADCLASWGSNPPAHVVVTERFAAAMVLA